MLALLQITITNVYLVAERQIPYSILLELDNSLKDFLPQPQLNADL